MAETPNPRESLVDDATLPRPDEHFARVLEIEKFRHDSLASNSAGEGVRKITGTLLDDGAEGVHAVMFDRAKFDRTAAEKWLSDQKLTAQKFEPCAQDTYQGITASFDGLLELQAAAVGASGLPSFRVQAYSGGPLKVSGFPYPVVVDLAGLQQYDEQSPIVLDHKVDQPLGHARVVNAQSCLTADGVFSHDNEYRARVVDAHRNGFKWRASIGCEILQAHVVPAGQVFYANGRNHQGPLIHATAARLKEITVCASGADPAATLTIAASAATSSAKGKAMTFREWLAAKGFEPKTLGSLARGTLEASYAKELPAGETAVIDVTEESDPLPTLKATAGGDGGGGGDVNAAIREMRQQYAAEQARLQGMTRARQAVLQPYGARIPATLHASISDLELKATSDGWPVERFKLEALRAARPHPVAIRSAGNDGAALNGRALEAACCVAGNMPSALLEKQFDDQTLQQSHTLYRGRMTLKRLLLEASWANGGTCRFLNDDGELRQVLHDIDWTHRELRAEFSTFSLPGILGNIANKFLMQGYWSIESAWQRIASIKTVTDFKPHVSFRFFGDMTYEKLGPNSQIRHGSVGEIKYANAVDTYAKMFSTSRKDIRNDDLGALTDLPRMMGMGAADAFNTLFWTCFLAGLDGLGVTMWYTSATTLANGGQIRPNKLTGTTAGATNSALGLEGLTNAQRLFLEQIKPNGTPLGIMPKWILVPPALKVTAENFQKFQEIREYPTATSGSQTGKVYTTGNPFNGQFEPITSAYLGTGSPLSGTSNTRWWMGADPAQVPLIEAAFLDGQQTPTVQSSDADFDTLGIQHRGFFDPGVAMQEPRAAVVCDGA